MKYLRYNTNMLDFLSLYGCDLQLLIAERNNSLGKVMLPMNRLDYDLEFIQLAKVCLLTLDETDVETRDLLSQSIDYKYEQLPLTVWNSLWQDNEVANLLSYSHGYYPVDNDQYQPLSMVKSLAQQLDELEAVITFEQTQLDKTALLKLQQQWLYEQRVGQLLMSIHMVTQKLNDATQMINQRIKEKPICYQQKMNPKAERIRQFFFNFYIVHIQSYFAVLHQQGDTLLPQLNRMASIYTAPTPLFDRYRLAILDPANKSGLWQKFEQAIKHHTEAWQSLLEQCGVRPGQNQH